MSRSAANTFAELTANGNTAGYELPGDVSTVRVLLDDAASYGGGTLKMQVSFDGGTTWFDYGAQSWTSGVGQISVTTVYARDIRFNLSGATGPSDMTVQVIATAKSQPSVAVKRITANGSYPVTLSRRPTYGVVYVGGTFASATVQLQQSFDGGTTWYDAASAVSAAGFAAFADTSVNARDFQLVVSGGGGTLDVQATVVGI